MDCVIITIAYQIMLSLPPYPFIFWIAQRTYKFSLYNMHTILSSIESI